MSEIINSNNIDQVIEINKKIKKEIYDKCYRIKMNPSLMKSTSISLNAIILLQEYGLIQIPIEDPYFSGAIFMKDGKRIPVINTALPRANQYFTAWHELYHLFFDQLTDNHIINIDISLEERKAEYFAAFMLLEGVERYFDSLENMDFISKVFHCMTMFQAPYKAVLISLYEYAVMSNNEYLEEHIKEVFDAPVKNLITYFDEIGLDTSLLKPSYVVNVNALKSKIDERKRRENDVTYHQMNEEYLGKIIKELNMLVRSKKDEITNYS